jgi:hypothetical protein
MNNRLPKDFKASSAPAPAQAPGPAAAKVHVLQGPFGTVKISVGLPQGIDGPDPLAFALRTFQEAVEAGADDPLHTTLTRLKQIARTGAMQPLGAALLLLEQLHQSGALPPPAVLIANTGVTPEDLANAMAMLSGRLPASRPLLEDRLDRETLN